VKLFTFKSAVKRAILHDKNEDARRKTWKTEKLFFPSSLPAQTKALSKSRKLMAVLWKDFV
jgi:hypothetical protein